MKTKTLIIGIVLTTLIITPLVIAAPDNVGPRGGRGFRGGAFQQLQGPAAIDGTAAPAQGPRGGMRRGGLRGQGPAGGRGGQRGGRAGGPMAGGQVGVPLGQLLNLTDEQKEQIQAIRQANKDETQLANETVRETMQALTEATQNGIESEIIAAGKLAGDALIQQALQRAAVASQIKEVLTPEQQTQFEESKTQVRGRLQQRTQQGPGARGPRRGMGPRAGNAQPPQD